MDLFGLFWIRPHWLWLLPVVWLAAVFAWRQHNVGGDWARVADAHLLKFLGGGVGGSQKNRHALTTLITTGLSVALLALAGPAWEQSASGSFSANQARVVILDLSGSMLAEDIKPSRIARARFKLMDLLDQVEEGQVGLVAYAGQAFVIAPLSSDMETIKNMVPALYPDIMPAPGSRPDEALALAAELINQAGFSSGEILLIADSSDQRTLAMATQLSDRGFSISVLGIGTKEGAPIPSGRGFIKDTEGKIVVAKLEERKLRAVASAGGGRYLKTRADNSELVAILKQGNQEFVATEDSEKIGLEQRWLDQGYWLMLLLLPLVLLSFRKGWLFVLPILLLPHTAQRAVAQPLVDTPVAVSQLQEPPQKPADVGSSKVVEAAGQLQQNWQKLWWNADQRAQQQLQQQRYEQALKTAQSPRFQAEALYRQGDYSQAMDLWKALEKNANTVEQQSDAAYNLGNALAAENELDDAIAAYARALELNPDNKDAQVNREILEQLKDQQNQDGEDSQEDGEQGEEGEEGENQDQQQDQDQDADEPQESEDSESAPDEASDEEAQDEQQEQEEQQSEEEQQAEEEDPQTAEMIQEAQWSEEDEQAKEQWLRRIPDDPGGLLRRKLIQEHKRRGRGESESQPW